MTPRIPLVPLERLKERQARVAEALGAGALLLPGAPIRRRSRDTEYPHRPDSDLYWLTGVTEPDAVALLLGTSHPDVGGDAPGRLLLFVRPRDPAAEQWSGLRLGPDGWGERSGADEVHTLDEVDELVAGPLRRAEALHYRMGEHPAREGLVLEALRWGRTRGSRSGTGPRRIVEPGGILDELRLRKDTWEIERLREAAALSVEGHRALVGRLGDGVPEWQLQAALEEAFRSGGGEGAAYESIVGSGANACVLHYVTNDGVARDGELVLVDAGASRGWYAGDITRTWPVSGRFASHQRALYEIVEAARAAGATAAFPGRPVADVHAAAVRVLTEGLVELGVLEGEVDELAENEGYKPFYPHQTSHWLGLDVHDAGDYAVDGTSRLLEPGMVLTVEPGLYFGPTAMEAAGAAAAPLQGVGIRIEDDILITADGNENLTAVLPTDPDEVERLVRGA